MISATLTPFPNLYTTSEIPSDSSTPEPVQVFTEFKVHREVIIEAWALLLKRYTEHESPVFPVDEHIVSFDTHECKVNVLSGPIDGNHGAAIVFSHSLGGTETDLPQSSLILQYDEDSGNAQLSASGTIPSEHLVEVSHQFRAILGTVLDTKGILRPSLRDQAEPKLSILNPEPELLQGPKLVHELLDQHQSDDIWAIEYLTENGHNFNMSYASLHRRASNLAARLSRLSNPQSQPMNKQANIPVLMGQCPELYVALLGILKSGAAFCPLQLDAPQERIKFVVGDISASILVTTSSSRHCIPEIEGLSVFVLDEIDLDKTPEIFNGKAPVPDDLAYIMYTSGSTGQPKGVGLSHLAVTQSLLAHDSLIPLFSRFLQFASPTFDVSQFEIFFTFFRGSTLLCCDKGQLLNNLPQVINMLSCDAAELTPTVAGSLLRARDAVPSLKLLLTIGEMLNSRVVEEFGSSEDRPSLLYGMYGPTEAAIHCTLEPKFDSKFKSGIIGYPFKTVSSYIVAPKEQTPAADDLAVLPVGHIGELVVGGHQLAVGYVNRKEQTEAAFIDSPKYGRVYRTGDKARQLPDGSIECLGRIQAGQVKLRGQRIELGEIEQVALKAEGCRLSVASIIKGNLVLFCLADSATLSQSEVRELCKEWLPAFMIPSDILVLQEIPRLPSGKVDKKTLEINYCDQNCNEEERTEEGVDEIGGAVLKIVQNLLGPQIRISSSLTRSGLDSLSSIRLASELRSHGYTVGAIDILNADNVRQLCGTLRDQNAKEPTRELSEDRFAPTREQAFSSEFLRDHKSEVEDIIPCTPLQAAMLAETAVDPSAYCNSVEIEFEEKIDATTIDRAIREVFAANAVLRSGFIAMESSENPYVQVVWKAVKADQLLWTNSLIPQDFKMSSSDSFLRPVKVQWSKTSSKMRCLFQMHHSIYDGWSMDLIIDDLACILNGGHIRSRPQFSRVVKYYASLEATTSQNSSKKFWKTYLRGFKPINFPSFCQMDNPSTQLTTSQHSIHITTDTIRSRMGRTFHPQALFQSALAYLMTAYLGTDDVIFGSVNSGRTIPITGIEDVVGPCIATLPLRVSGAAYDTVAGLLINVSNMNRKHAEHCTLPLQEMKRYCDIKPGEALFDVLFVWQETLNSQNLDFETCRIVGSTDQLEFKLVFEVEPRQDNLAVTVRHRESLIPATQVGHILQQLEAIMDLFLEHQDLRIDEVLARVPKQCLSLLDSKTNGINPKQRSRKKQHKVLEPEILMSNNNHHGIYSIQPGSLSTAILTGGERSDSALRGAVGELIFMPQEAVNLTSEDAVGTSKVNGHPEPVRIHRTGCTSRLLPDGTVELFGPVEDFFQKTEPAERIGDSISHQSGKSEANDQHQLAGLERTIAVATAHITNTPIFDIHRRTSFFALGVDSLSAVAFAQALRSHTSSKVEVSQILKFPCVAELAAAISDQPATDDQIRQSPNTFSEKSLEAIKYNVRELLGSKASETIRPCTPLQEGMLSAELSSRTNAYSNHTLFKINGDIRRLQDTINVMFARHDILRTCFVATNDQTFAFAQVVLKHYVPRWETVETQQDKLRSEVNKMVERKLLAVDQDTPPLRLTSLTTPEKTYVILSMHHALYDGQAMQVLLSEIEEAYRGESLQQSVPFDSFLDVALTQDVHASDIYWAELLSDFVPVSIPQLDSVGRAMNGNFTESMAIQSRNLTISLAELEDAAKSASTNLLSIVQAAWARTLMVVLGDDDVCFGNVVSGRTVSLPGVTTLVAPCFNTLPLRVKVSQTTTIDDLIGKLQQINSRSHEYQFTPLRRIQKLQNDKGEALFDNIFILQQPAKHLDRSIWELQKDMGDMGFPLVCEVIPNPANDTVQVNLHFKNSRMSHKAIDVVLAEFLAALEACVSFPSRKVLQPETDGIVKMIKAVLSAYLEDLPSVHSSLPSQRALKMAKGHAQDKKQAAPTSLSSIYEGEVQNAFASFSNVPKAQITRSMTISQLGLDSISAIQIAKSLRDQGFQISAEDVLEYPTVSALAGTLRKTKVKESESHSVVAFQDFGDRFRERICGLASIPVKSVENVLPCSSLQAGMIAQFLHSSGRDYFNNFIHELGPHVDLKRLRGSWKQVVSSHKMLRTGIVTLNEQDCPFAMVCYTKDTFVLPWNEVEASGDGLEALKAERSTLARRAFEAFHQPPWFLSSSSSNGRVWLQISAHHALFDAESLQLVIKDVQDIYQDSQRLQFQSIEPLLSFIIDGSKDEDGAHEAFWLDTLHDVTVTKFPNSLPLRQDGKTLRIESLLATASLDKLERGCQQRGISVQAAIQVAWANLLSAYTGEPDVCFGLVLAGRESEQAENTVFPCSSTVPFRCIVDGDDSSLLEKTMAFNASVRKHRYSPLNQIRRWIGMEGSALFDTLLVFQKTPGQSLDQKFLQIADEDASVEYPVSIELIPEDSGGLRIQSTFWDDVLPTAQAKYMLQEFDVFLSGVIGGFRSNRVNRDIAKPKIYSSLRAKDPEIPSDVTLLHQYVERGAREHPNRVAFEYYTEVTPTAKPQQWTYKMLDEIGIKYAHVILQQVNPGSIVVTCFDKCPEASFSFLGILKAGCSFLAVDQNAPVDRKTFIVDDSKAAAILTTPDYVNQFKDQVKVPIIDANQVHRELSIPKNFVSPNIDPEDTSYCLYTSGSTGTPKGCILSHRNAVQFISYFQRLFKGRWTENSRWLQFASFHFDVMVLEQFWPWSVGISCVSAARDALFEDLAGTLNMLNITHIDLTPSLARLITPEEVPSLCDGIFITGGEPLKQEVLDAWGHTGAIHNGYGPTECTIGCTMFARVPQHGKASNIGVQYDNAGTYVLKPGTTEIVIRGAVGELCIAGVLVGKGYLGRPDLTREKFPFVEAFGERIYRTGDLVRLQCDDTFEFVGRIDDQVKLRGQRLELGEINAAITNSSATVDDVTTLVVKVGQKQTEQLCSFVVMKSAQGLKSSELIGRQDPTTLKGIRENCQEKLPPYMVPTQFFLINYLPLTTNNKVDAKALKALLDKRSISVFGGGSVNYETDENDAKPSDESKKVATILSGFLRLPVDQFSGSTNFFQAGLDSISVFSFVQELRKDGFENATSQVVMKSQTINALAESLRQVTDAQDGSLTQAKQFIAACKHRYRPLAAETLELDLNDIEVAVPLTPLQHGIVARSLESDEGLYFNRFVFEIAQNVDIEELRSSWQAIVDEVPVLRTCFIPSSDGYIQAVPRMVKLPWTEHWLNEPNTLKFKSQIWHQEWCKGNGNIIDRPFEIHIAKGANQNYMILHLFHGLYDAISLPLILGKVQSEYQGVGRLECGPSFHEVLAYGPLKESRGAKEFWISRLKNAQHKPLINEVLTKENNPVTVFRTLDNLSQLEDVRRKLNVTHQAFVQVAWMATFQTYVQAPATTGLLVSGRSIDCRNVERTIGPLFNTLPFCLQFAKDETWESAIRSCHDFNISALPYQHTPLRHITKWIGKSSHEPLFDALLVFQKNTGVDDSRFNSLWKEIDNAVAADYPLALEVEQSSDSQLKLTLVAQNDLMNESRCDSFLTSFCNVLVAILEEPNQKLRDFLGKDFENVTSSRAERVSEHVAPEVNDHDSFEENDVERSLRDIVASVAGIDPDNVRKGTSVFELGLDSVDAIKISSRLKREGFILSVSNIMRRPTIYQMAQNVQRSHDSDSAAALEKSFEDIKHRLEADIKSVGHNQNDVETILPATPLQEAIFAEMEKSTMRNYLNHDVLKLAEGTEIERLMHAWETVIAGSPILRTSFVQISDIDVGVSYAQLVRRHYSRPFPVARSQPTAFEGVFKAIREKLVTSGDDTVPFRLTLVRDSSTTYLIVSMSHALYDGWSLGLLHHDVQKAYQGTYKPRPSYQGILKNIVAGANHRTESFWRNAVYGSQGCTFPLRQRHPDMNGSEVHFKERTSKISATELQKFCRAENITMQALGQSCWAFVLAAYCRSFDVSFGVVLLGRDGEDADKILFPTMNTVIIRLLLHGSRREMVRYVQTNLGDVMEHQHYPLRKVQRMASLPQGSKLFNTLFIYQRRPAIMDAEDQIYSSVGGASDLEYPISVEMEIIDNALVWRTSSKEEALTEEQTSELLARLDDVLQAIVEVPDEPSVNFEGESAAICGQIPFKHAEETSTGHDTVSGREQKESFDAPVSSETNQKVKEVLSTVSKIPVSDIADSDTIYNLGLDSINAIKLASLMNRERIKLTVSQILQASTVQRIGLAIDNAKEIRANGASKVDGDLVLEAIMKDVDKAALLKKVSVRKDDVEQIIPATAAQTLFLSLWSNTQGAMFYPTFDLHISNLRRPEILLNAWKVLMKEVPLLRTVFVATETDSSPLCQVVLKEVDNNFTSTESSEAKDGAQQFADSYINLHAPEKASSQYFQIRIHHALYDAVSLPRLLQQLQDICNNIQFSNTIPNVSSGFHDFLAQINTSQARDDRQSFWSYYLSQSKANSIHEPLSAGKTDSHERSGAYRACAMQSISHLDALSRKHGISLQSLLFSTVAGIYAEQNNIDEHEDVVFGIYLANRGDEYEHLIEPTLNIVPLRIRSPLQRDPVDVAKEIQEDLHAISRRARPFVSLWEIDRWTGVKIDCFLNFLRLPDQEDKPVNGMFHEDSKERKVSIELLDSPHMGSEDEGSAEPQNSFEIPMGLRNNTVSDSYVPCIDVEAAVREGGLAMGVFGPATTLDKATANRMIDRVCSRLRDLH